MTKKEKNHILKMATPSAQLVTQRLQAAGVPYNSTTIQTLCGGSQPMCGCQGRKYFIDGMGVKKMCGCTSTPPGMDDRPSLPRGNKKW